MNSRLNSMVRKHLCWIKTNQSHFQCAIAYLYLTSLKYYLDSDLV